MSDAEHISRILGPDAFSLGHSIHPCSYLEGREATDEAYLAWQLHPQRYFELMNRGFRRSGRVVYRPVCAACSACRAAWRVGSLRLQ